MDVENKKATVHADNDQAALIVGRGGVNISLASKLTGYEIEFIREGKTVEEYEDDIELIDLRSELGDETYNLLINSRFDTALDVLRAGKEKLSEIEGFSAEEIDRVLTLIQSELEEE